MKIVDLCRKACPWIALTLLIVVVFVVKLWVLGEYPPSDDMGVHLAILKTYFHGLEVRPQLSFHHPPLYYLLVLEPLTILFPTFLALNVAAALISTVIAVPFFFLVREITGSNWVGIITSFLFMFSELYSEIMGWGGIPNLFGIFFMLFSIYFFIKAVEGRSWKNAVLAGVFFSFAIGAHHLTAVYYAVALVISVLLLVVLRAVKLRSLLKTFLLLIVVTVPLSLPYLHVYAFLVPQRVNVATTFLPSIELYYSSLRASFATVTREWPATFVLVAVAVLGAVNLWRRHRARTVTGVVASLAVTVFVLAFIFHPFLMPRAFYFIHIPIFLAFGVLLSDIFMELRGRDLLQRGLFYVLLAIVVLSLASAAYSRMIVAKDYYQSLDDATVEALDWIKEYTSSDAVILTNYGMLPGWIEGYSERKTISPRQLGFLVTSIEYEESIVASEILSGNQIVMSPYLMVSDHFPTNCCNPQIAVRAEEWYEELVFFQDPWQTLQKNNTLSVCPVKTVENVTQTNSSVAVTYRYSSDQAVLIRKVEVHCNPQTDIFYDLKLTNSSSIEEIEIPLCVFPTNVVNDYMVSDGVVVLDLATPFGEVGGVQVSVVETNGELVNVTYLEEQSAFVFALRTEGSELYAHFRVLFDLEIGHTDGIRYLDAQELLEINNITHVLLNKKRVLDLQRFTSEIDRYEQVFENEAVLIVKLKSISRNCK